MNANKLKLNDGRTEFFVSASRHHLSSYIINNVRLMIGEKSFQPCKSIRNLGVTFELSVNLSLQAFKYHLQWRIQGGGGGGGAGPHPWGKKRVNHVNFTFFFLYGPPPLGYKKGVGGGGVRFFKFSGAKQKLCSLPPPPPQLSELSAAYFAAKYFLTNRAPSPAAGWIRLLITYITCQHATLR